MKKIIVTVLAILTVMTCFAACNKNQTPDTPSDKVVDISATSDSDKTTDSQVIDFETTRPKEEPSTIKIGKTMKLNLPWSVMEDEANGNIDSFAATYGYKIKKEKDGTATMTMDGLAYSLLLSRVGMKTIRALGDIVDSDVYPYTVGLADYSEDFSYILMKVDTKAYKKHSKDWSYESLAAFLGEVGLYYQTFTVEEDNKCEVVLASHKTGKIVYNQTYTTN